MNGLGSSLWESAVKAGDERGERDERGQSKRELENG
jgi:hypothetical protein